ncbi:hypothetical protein EYF80_067578 [Liparis tanakae]|uniref:Uncharacterized protein n=1 Tax=Liparis tanakae TaxID=230148 RepID=A0A4Z2E0R1_9TELE|nr:hypothetical protein EYF80_067578 [Liparis tanakae]
MPSAGRMSMKPSHEEDRQRDLEDRQRDLEDRQRDLEDRQRDLEDRQRDLKGRTQEDKGASHSLLLFPVNRHRFCCSGLGAEMQNMTMRMRDDKWTGGNEATPCIRVTINTTNHLALKHKLNITGITSN